MKSHYHEAVPSKIKRVFERRGVSDLKADLWNAFVDSNLVGICEDDCSAIPRFLPLSYLPTIKRTCRDITEFLMKLISLPPDEIKEITPSTPIVDYLINELHLLKHRKKRITGSMRFDMAVIGKPGPNNPPKLMEVNEIGFDGTGRSSYIQETILRIFPELKRHVVCIDTAGNETRNMRRLGCKLARFQYDIYNWEEEVIMMKAHKAGIDLRLFSPNDFEIEIEHHLHKLKNAKVRLKDDRLQIGKDGWMPNAFQISYSFELKDYLEAPGLFRKLIKTKTPQYSPFITGLIAPKTVLTQIADFDLRKRLLGSARAKRLAGSILPAFILAGNEGVMKKEAPNFVIKHADGMGGEMVFVGKQLKNRLARIPKNERKHWVVQDRIRLNTMDVDGILSRKRRVIADLGIYINYDWNGKRFTNFRIGGFITRATNRSLKVNVSGGGIQVPVMLVKEQ